MEEPCLSQRWPITIELYYDSVTGASLPSKLCEEAMQLEIKYMKEMTVYTLLRARSRERTRTHVRLGHVGFFTNKGDTEHPFIWARLVAHETKRTTNMDLTDMSMTFAATPPVDGFRISSFKGDDG